MFHGSNHVSVALRPRCIFLRTYFSLPSVSYCTYRCHQQRDLDRHQVFRAYNLYILYNVDRTENCGTLACMSLGVDNAPSTETLNFLWQRKELISLIRFIESFNLDNLCSKPRSINSLIPFRTRSNYLSSGRSLLLYQFTRRAIKLTAVNYRGISMLTTSYKILFNILFWRLSPYIDEIIGDQQCEFRRNK
jgi:hypothetical protein